MYTAATVLVHSFYYIFSIPQRVPSLYRSQRVPSRCVSQRVPSRCFSLKVRPSWSSRKISAHVLLVFGIFIKSYKYPVSVAFIDGYFPIYCIHMIYIYIINVCIYIYMYIVYILYILLMSACRFSSFWSIAS